MITVINKKSNTEYVYTGTQYNEIGNNILDHHIAQGELLVSVAFNIVGKYTNEDGTTEPLVPGVIYEGDVVDAAVVAKAKAETIQWLSEQKVDNIVVTVNGKDYSGSAKAQSEIMVAIQVLTEKGTGETLVRRSLDGTLNDLAVDDFKAVQVAVSNEQEIAIKSVVLDDTDRVRR